MTGGTAPMWDYWFVERYDQECAEALAGLLGDGWEPFAAEHSPGGVSRVHLRRPVMIGS